MNRIGGVMLSMLISSAVDSMFEPLSGQTKDYKISICCFSSKYPALKENETNWWFGVLQNLELIKKWKYDFFNENFTRAGVKARLYLIDLKFPAKHAGCHFSLISDVTPSIPIYQFLSIMTEFQKWYYCFDAVKLNR
jgi:hypothetical protein